MSLQKLRSWSEDGHPTWFTTAEPRKGAIWKRPGKVVKRSHGTPIVSRPTPGWDTIKNCLGLSVLVISNWNDMGFTTLSSTKGLENWGTPQHHEVWITLMNWWILLSTNAWIAMKSHFVFYQAADIMFWGWQEALHHSASESGSTPDRTSDLGTTGAREKKHTGGTFKTREAWAELFLPPSMRYIVTLLKSFWWSAFAKGDEDGEMNIFSCWEIVLVTRHPVQVCQVSILLSLSATEIWHFSCFRCGIHWYFLWSDVRVWGWERCWKTPL